jgi:hypothetical protein
VRRQEFLCFLTLRYAPLDLFLEKLLLVELPLFATDGSRDAEVTTTTAVGRVGQLY